MRTEFHVTGAGRKALVTAMGEILEVRPKYLGMPTAAYEVDYFRIDKNGTVEFDDRADSVEIENLLEKLAERGFAGEGQKTATEAPKETAENDTAETDTAPQDENVGLTVAMPLGSANIDNLKKLLEAKGSLIKKASALMSCRLKLMGIRFPFPGFQKRTAVRQGPALILYLPSAK